MFSSESRGLQLLGEYVRTPEVLTMAMVNGYHVLVIEWVEQGLKTDGFWKNFGEQLVKLHSKKADRFGLHFDNFMGSLPQSNTYSNSWTEFFVHQRLQPQLELALSKKLMEPAQVAAFDNLYKKLPEIFADEPPCLLHGDLWSGNLMCNEKSEPVLIDPAVYYGHRSMDLGMTTLFGGFDPAFYEAYNSNYPLHADHAEQWEISNLYPLLVHLNLFGIQYLPRIAAILNRYI